MDRKRRVHPAIRRLAWDSGLTLLAIALYGTALTGIGLAAVQLASRYVWLAPAAIADAETPPTEPAEPAAVRPITWIDGSDESALRAAAE